MMIIKNRTPYIGKIFLKFEKFAEYSGATILNNIHLNLGFTKLVSRIKPEMATNMSWEVDQKKINLINANTGLLVEDHWVDKREPKEEFTIHNACVDPETKEFICNIEIGWYYYCNILQYIPNTHSRIAWDEMNSAWVAFTKAGFMKFTIGDMLFDQEWKPNEDELLTYQKYYVKELDKYEAGCKEWEESTSKYKVDEVDMTLASWAATYIPLMLHGSIKIETKEQALLAATNFAQYVN